MNEPLIAALAITRIRRSLIRIYDVIQEDLSNDDLLTSDLLNLALNVCRQIFCEYTNLNHEQYNKIIDDFCAAVKQALWETRENAKRK